MKSLAELAIVSQIPIVFANEQVHKLEDHYTKDQKSIIDSYLFRKELFFNILPETIIDKETLRLIQVSDLHESIDHTDTAIGSAVLYRSLMQPPTSLELIHAKQESLMEIEADDNLRQALDDYIGEFADREKVLFRFLNGKIDKAVPYWDFKKAVKAGTNISKAAKAIPIPESEYLRLLLASTDSFEETSLYSMMSGPLFRTFQDLKPKREVKLYTPKWKLRPSRFSLDTLVPLLPIIGLFVGLEKGLIERGPQLEQLAPLVVMNMMLGVMYFTVGKPAIDMISAIMPLRDMAVNDPSFLYATDAVGKIDELLSFYKYGKAVPHEVTIPEITDDPYHHFEATDLKNPILAKEDPNFVGNNISLSDSRLTSISGPNSGGKTTLCKSVFQEQIKGQTGNYVLARWARINIADKMGYQYYVPDELQNKEGDFGENLSRTKYIFENTTPKSLVVLNTLASGTTIEEEIAISTYVLNGFHAIGNNTLFVTHNHKLLKHLQAKGQGQFIQFDYDDEPTYQWKPGISLTSHATRVAEKIGFTDQDVQNHLEQQGYLD